MRLIEIYSRYEVKNMCPCRIHSYSHRSSDTNTSRHTHSPNPCRQSRYFRATKSNGTSQRYLRDDTHFSNHDCDCSVVNSRRNWFNTFCVAVVWQLRTPITQTHAYTGALIALDWRERIRWWCVGSQACSETIRWLWLGKLLQFLVEATDHKNAIRYMLNRRR